MRSSSRVEQVMLLPREKRVDAKCTVCWPSSKHSAQSHGPAQQDWLNPVDADAPCGPDLEYDPEFIVLSAQIVAKAEAQYGDFVSAPAAINWSDIDRDCRRLMMRSKDMRLAVLFARCRTRLLGAAGLAEGVGLLAAWLAAFPETVHPQLAVDVDHDVAREIRMNALQALTDADGLLGDIREIALTRSTATRLQVRDVERAFAHPRSNDSLAPESVDRQLDELRKHLPSVTDGFDDALLSIAAIDAWSVEHLGVFAPDLSPVTRLLQRVSRPHRCAEHTTQDSSSRHEGVTKDIQDTRRIQDVSAEQAQRSIEPPEAPTRPALEDRDSVAGQIREARKWFELHEPSSPVPVLLKRAERLVGRRYAEVAQAIPADLLAQWSADEI
jgi:type VI secretion system protein ImpA